MKWKFFLCILLIFLTSCSVQKNNAIVCSTVTHDESVRIDIEYEYDSYGEIKKISRSVSVSFNKEQLQEKSLQDYYDELFVEDEKGVHYIAEIDEKNNTIVSITTIDLSIYDFINDHLELGHSTDYLDVTKLIEDIGSLGYYRCK